MLFAFSVMNLIKNIVGTSILAASYGVARSGVVPSIIICLIFAVLSGLSFGLIGSLSGESDIKSTPSYRGVCEKYIHRKSGVWIDLLMAIYTFPACIAYSVFLTDCIRIMLPSEDLFVTSRTFICLMLTFTILLPLCCISSFRKLSFTSLIGIGSILYCYIFVSTDLAKNSDPQIVQSALWWPPSGSLLGFFPMANIYASCYVVHYNSAKFYKDMQNPTPRRFYAVSLLSNAFVFIFCGSFAVLGFARFGPDTPANLLVGYSGAYAVWIATCVSVITTFPFVFDAGRNSFISALEGFKLATPNTLFWATTLFWVPVLTLSAIFITSLSHVVGVSGSICGMTVGFTLPGLIFANRARMKQQSRLYVILGYTLMVLGMILTVVGLISMFVSVNSG